MYVPGLPLPRLVTLNLRSADVKTLSQSLVKMSPNLKDLFLDGNPIKCSELLSIAEWATPCRADKIDDGNDGDDNDESGSESNKFPTLFRGPIASAVRRAGCEWCRKWRPVRVGPAAADGPECVGDESVIRPNQSKATTAAPAPRRSTATGAGLVTEAPSTKLNTAEAATTSVTSRTSTTASAELPLTTQIAPSKPTKGDRAKDKPLSSPKKSGKSDSPRGRLAKSETASASPAPPTTSAEVQKATMSAAPTEASSGGPSAKSTRAVTIPPEPSHKSDVLAESSVDPVTLPNDVIREHSTAKQTTKASVSRLPGGTEKTKGTTTAATLKNDDNDVHKTEKTLNLNGALPTRADLLSAKQLPAATAQTETSNASSAAGKNLTDLYESGRATAAIVRAPVRARSHTSPGPRTKTNRIMVTPKLASPANDRNYFRINDEINTNWNGRINDNETRAQTNELAARPALAASTPTRPAAAELADSTVSATAGAAAASGLAKKQRKLKKLVKTEQNAATGRADSNNHNDNRESMGLMHTNCDTRAADGGGGKKCKPNILLVDEKSELIETNASSGNKSDDVRRFFLALNESVRNISAARFFNATLRGAQSTLTATKETHSTGGRADEAGDGSGDEANTSTLGGFTEPLNYVRESPGHPGVFVVIGVTIGVFITVCLVHLYRCNKPYVRRGQRYSDAQDDQEQYIVPHHTMLSLDTFSAAEPRFTDTPIDLW